MKVSGKVAIIGHSFIRRLQNSIHVGGSKFKPNFGLEGVKVKFFGKGGGKIDFLDMAINQMVETNFIPNVVLIQIGENDIDSCQFSHKQFLLKFRMGLDRLKALGVGSISFISLFPRNKFRHVRPQIYRARKAMLTCSVALLCRRLEFLKVERCNKILRPVLLSADGVHLGRRGMKKYFHEVKFMVIRALARNS